MFSRLLAKQLAKPAGPVGHLVGRTMNSVNKQMNLFTVQRMDIQPEHQVMDIGFGGGVSLDIMKDLASEGLVVGLEMSKTMLVRGRKTYAKLIEEGRLEIAKGIAESIPYPDNRFDRICTVNTVYFWKDPTQAINEIHRVLKPKGLLALSFRPPNDMKKLKFTRHGFNIYDQDQVGALLEGASFSSVHFVKGNDSHLGFVCVTAIKNPAAF